ncbi:GNAT family N-acetyltransferase [Clavibacter sp. CT19]|uniref:GNAT family N-acetyltransferase n=1 Tax=Clavibacter sp. CT19 TaxID=3018990 RepID=UPI0022EA560D|nr:GNAT family N-acetyltransferase [Clavibacter sp. CT19]MDA3804778.1 GNAT family N-acetyltransferase [Clavibacter sp. CT19]
MTSATAPDASAARLLSAYDAQLRTDAETPNALDVRELGPLRLAVFPGGRGFVTYRDLGDLDEPGLRDLVPEALARFRDDPAITGVEWKTRGHDRAPGLDGILRENGFVPEERETIMLGEARALAVDVPLPAGVTLRRITAEVDVRAMSAMQAEVFGDVDSADQADAMIRRLGLDDGMEMWVAWAAGRIVSAGRLEPVPGSDFAGIWGGATVPEWRGRGIYRALTAARARSALAAGRTLIHSDSTDFSRPILERSGLLACSTTTPYAWSR